MKFFIFHYFLFQAKNNFEDIKKDCEKDRKIEKEIVERLNAYTNRLQDKIENLQSIVYESFVWIRYEYIIVSRTFIFITFHFKPFNHVSS